MSKELETKVAALEEELATFKKENEQLLAVNAELQAELESSKIVTKSLKPTEPPVVKIDKVEYEVLRAASIPGLGKMSAEEIAADLALCEKLIEKGSGIIKKKS